MQVCIRPRASCKVAVWGRLGARRRRMGGKACEKGRRMGVYGHTLDVTPAPGGVSRLGPARPLGGGPYVRGAKWTNHANSSRRLSFDRNSSRKAPLCSIFKCGHFWPFQPSRWQHLTIKDFGLSGSQTPKFRLACRRRSQFTGVILVKSVTFWRDGRKIVYLEHARSILSWPAAG